MAKRGPQSELTDRNWDQEEEPEEAGLFVQASKETIQSRVIKKAKRRGEEGFGDGKKAAFGGFAGFGKMPSSAPSNAEKSSPFKSSSGSDSLFKASCFSGGATSSVDNMESKDDLKENSSYLLGLKSLNESVLAWIKQHVDKNPYIILTPIFKDYEKYLSTLEAKKTTNGSSSAFSDFTAVKQSDTNETKSLFKSTNETKSLFKSSVPNKSTEDTDLKKDDKDNNKEAPKPVSTFTFGSGTSNGEGFKFSSSTNNTGFSFGKSSTSGFSFAQTQSTTGSLTTTTTATTSGFSFGSNNNSSVSGFGNSGFSFGALAAKTMAQKSDGTVEAGGSQDQNADDDYVPPKPEVKEIKEENSLYSKRCKLFYQKEGGWAERGVGNVHLKPLDGSKTQILVRADTNLGNILLNIMLTPGLPVSRQGKNNVLLVCVPNPPLKESKVDADKKPIPMLIRVKTGEEADELLAKLEERKTLL